MIAPAWKVPHSEHRYMPLRSKQPHTGQTATVPNAPGDHVFAICSLYEHVFLVTSDEVPGSVFLNGDGFFLIIKLYNDAKHFLVIEHQTNVRTSVMASSSSASSSDASSSISSS